MNNLSDQDLVSVYELYYGEASRARPEPWSQSPPKKFQLRYRENVAAILQAQSQIWGGGCQLLVLYPKVFNYQQKIAYRPSDSSRIPARDSRKP